MSDAEHNDAERSDEERSDSSAAKRSKSVDVSAVAPVEHQRKVRARPTLKFAFLVLLVAFVWLAGGSLIGGSIFSADDSLLKDLAFLAIFGGFTLILMAGFGLWSKAKGYSAFVGMSLVAMPGVLALVMNLPVLAVFQIVGLFVLASLKDHSAKQ